MYPTTVSKGDRFAPAIAYQQALWVHTSLTFETEAEAILNSQATYAQCEEAIERLFKGAGFEREK